MEQVRRENPLIFSRGVAITRKLGFPDVIMPGESAATTPSQHEQKERNWTVMFTSQNQNTQLLNVFWFGDQYELKNWNQIYLYINCRQN